MVQKILDFDGLKHFVKAIKKHLSPKQRIIKNRNYIDNITNNELVILDNSQFSYKPGQTWWVNPKHSIVIDNDAMKKFEFIVVTGNNTVTVQFADYISAKGNPGVLQANSTYLFNVYGSETQVQGGQTYGKIIYMNVSKIS